MTGDEKTASRRACRFLLRGLNAAGAVIVSDGWRYLE
jgi:hypothetical protein